MRSLRALSYSLLLFTVLGNPVVVSAQSSGDQPATCGHVPWYLRAAGGGVVGAFVGLVGSKIRMSDWDDRSRTSSGVQLRNQTIGGGAAVGAMIGGLAFIHRSCGRSTAAPARWASPPSGPRAITAAEIQQSSTAGTAYDLVFALRPNWVAGRGLAKLALADSSLVVYLNDIRMGDVNSLREIPAVGITGAYYFDAAQAAMKWGGGHLAGAIQVIAAGSNGGR